MILEVLISTMDRKDISFLNHMFINNNLSDLNILIINQTDSKTLLKSDAVNIRVINSFEYGLSKSRNLAIEHTIGDICLIADDDAVYEKDFYNTILNAFKKNPSSTLITFKAKNLKGTSYREYDNQNTKHTQQTIKDIMSLEVAFNSEKIKAFDIKFDTRFGLGSEFPTAEEYLFSRDIINKGLIGKFYNEFIVSHPQFNSGMALGNDDIVYARAALNYKILSFFVYLWIPKYMFFLMRHSYIKPKELISKVLISFQGIKAYRESD
ncbi:glycosyltransferase family A protein [Aquimarina addita]|uniref:Glycosyltransferase family A protein n=1 Tax=Aquimarina addita TaxID=870485 RepID=A0ABP6UKD2_9FLAO